MMDLFVNFFPESKKNQNKNDDEVGDKIADSGRHLVDIERTTYNRFAAY